MSITPLTDTYRSALPAQNTTPPPLVHQTDAKVSTVWGRFKSTALKAIGNCAIRNPLKTVMQRGNEYVTEQWSEEYFIGCKKNLEIAKTGLKMAFYEAKSTNFTSGMLHLMDAVTALIVVGLNIELGNFLKGALGVIISTGKFVYHGVEFSLRSILAILMVVLTSPALFCSDKYKEFFVHNCKEIIASFGFMLKDLVSVITCVGHAIPAWLPLLIMAVSPPVGVALFIIKNAAKFTGIFDLLAYGGTALLLFTKAKFAELHLNSDPENREAQKAMNAWKKLKKELNPFKTIEGATIAAYAVHVIVTAGSTAADFFAPGSSHLVKYGAYAIQGVAVAALAGAVYYNSRRRSQPEERELLLADPARDSRSESV